LNGCFTAASEADESFLIAIGQPGFFGFIGTEAAIPDDFALRFGQEFVRRFCDSGNPLFHVMDELWREHWPLGLLYSIYCSPDIRTRPPKDGECGPAPRSC